MKLNWIIIFGLAVPSEAFSQEIKCTQVFMNKTEKAICGSDEIMALDTKMSMLAHRAEFIDESYRADQKQFRRELKACEGEVECLNSAYNARITYLETKISSGPPLTQDQERLASAKDNEAQTKLDKQASARNKYAAEASNDQDHPQSLADYQESADSIPKQQNMPSEIAQAVDTPTHGAETQQAINLTPDNIPNQQNGSNWISYVIIALIFLFILSSIISILTWFSKIVRRCPNCTKWWAAVEIDSTSTYNTEYEMRKFDDIHKDRNNMIRGKTTRTHQVAVNVTHTTTHYCCNTCKHTWTINTTSRK